MSYSNSLKKIKSLKTKKGRNVENLFLIEGKRLVGEYLFKSYLVNEIVISEQKIKNYDSIIKFCNKKKIKIFVVPGNIAEKLSDTRTPSGILGTCKIKFLKKNYNSNRWLFLHKIKDPGNLGTILRSAAWFNINNVALSTGCADPFNNKVVRSAMGAHIHVNIHQKVKIEEFIKHKFVLIGADQNGDSIIEKSDLSKKIVLCLGGESEGFDKLTIKKLDKLVPIKKIGHGESLNVAIAGSIFMNYLS
tara:strand:+ start:2855 stop:3595 length:741 start_codon:yes stop_codon:yes gene_type:complete